MYKTITFACALSAILLDVSTSPVNYLSVSDHNEYTHFKNELLNHYYDEHKKTGKKVYHAQDFIGHKNKVQIHGQYDRLPEESPMGEIQENAFRNIEDFLSLLRNATENSKNSTLTTHDEINKVMVIVKTYKEPQMIPDNATVITEEDPKVVKIYDDGLTLNDVLEANAENNDAKTSESTNNNVIEKLPETTTKGYEVWEFDI